MRNITFDWSNILHKIDIWSTEGEWHTISDMVWEPLPIFPACNIINLTNYFKNKHLVPKQVFIYVSRQNNLRISIYPEDNNIALHKRPLKTSMLDYNGPDISRHNLNKPRIERMILLENWFKLRDHCTIVRSKMSPSPNNTFQL